MKRMIISGARSRQATLFSALLSAFCVISIILYPAQAFGASIQGLHIWWKFVFPPMLPVLILFEIMTGYGLIRRIGRKLEPLLRRLIRLPAGGGTACVANLIAGAPSGARVIAELRQRQAVTRDEAGYLLAISHSVSPVLIVTVIGVGFLGSARLGFMLAIIYYCSQFLTAMLMRLAMPPARVKQEAKSTYNQAERRSQAQTGTMLSAMPDEQPALGKILGDAVTAAIQRLMMIGGYMIICSVIARLIALARFNLDLADVAIWPSVLDLHLGAYEAAHAGNPWNRNIAMISAILGFGGSSLLLQTMAGIAGSDIGVSRYLLSRVAHAVCAGVLACLLWSPLHQLLDLWFP